MFESLLLRGPSASIMWGYHRAAALGAWRVLRRRDALSKRIVWRLAARLTPEIDRFKLRQTRPQLLFTAPRKGGYWCWPVRSVQVYDTKLIAELDPPEY